MVLMFFRNLSTVSTRPVSFGRMAAETWSVLPSWTSSSVVLSFIAMSTSGGVIPVSYNSHLASSGVIVVGAQ